jgi:CubicO group peptidase (beta-lactamase class C family)
MVSPVLRGAVGLLFLPLLAGCVSSPPRALRPIGRAEVGQLEATIASAMERTGTPGSAVAIVEDGRIVYLKAFGVRELGRRGRVTPETRMMIGSTGKSMTTLMMATLVDEGRMSWDTPAAQVYPGFALSDPGLTRSFTMRHLVCNCTGIERRDTELFFPSRPRTAEDVIRSLRTYSFTGPFGATYNYSNPLVAAGGYLAARTAGGGTGDLYDDYLTQMQRRVFDPIGMRRTTFSFDVVQADPDHAAPYGRTADSRLVPIPLRLEQLIGPVAAAGGSWSTARDMARYMVTQLNRGVSPNGRRVVSAENLEVTWQPQVAITPQFSYALGWVVGFIRGVRMLNHGGGTSGFTTDITLLPDSGLGIAVLTNAQNDEAFTRALRDRVLELAFGWPERAEAALDRNLEQIQQAIREQATRLEPRLDRSAVGPWLGAYANPALGEVRLAMRGDALVMETDEFACGLRSAGNATYLVWDPPLAGLQVKLERDAAGRPAWRLISTDPDQLGVGTYPFSRLP